MALRGPGARIVTHDAREAAKARIAAAPWSNLRLALWRRIVLFIEGELRITSGLGAGRQFKLRPWQVEIIREIYRQKGEKGSSAPAC